MAFEELQGEDISLVPGCDDVDYATMGIEQLAKIARHDDDAAKELARRYGGTKKRTSDFNYDARHLAGLHDQSTHGRGGGSVPGAGLGGPYVGVRRHGAGDILAGMSDAQVEALKADFKEGSLEGKLVKGADGKWRFDEETQQRHDEIVAKAVLGIEEGVPIGDRTANLMGGGSRSGKSSFLDSEEGAQFTRKGEAVQVDVDEIKGELPGYKPTAPAFVHEESSYLGRRITAAAQEREQRLFIDQTGNQSYTRRVSQVEDLRAAGYTVNARYMTMPTAQSVLLNLEQGRKGKRSVPTTVLLANHATVSQIVPRAASEGLFDSLKVINTSIKGKPRTIFDSTGGGIINSELWNEFVDKGKET